jgi:3-keto-disaccharide hydrolase
VRAAPALLALLLLVLPCLAEPLDDKEKADGFVPLFNAKDLAGWKTYESQPDNWTVEDGLLVCAGKGGGWLGTDQDYANFVLRLEYKLKPAGNSGVYIRAPEKGHISRVGMEIQILDDTHPSYAGIDFYQYTGSIYHVVAPTRRAARPAGEWNSMEVRAEGRRVVVVLNGKKVVDADLDWYLKDPEVAREHTGLARTTGRIGLQSHTDRVEFRNLRLRELK